MERIWISKRKSLKYVIFIKDKSYQFKLAHPNDGYVLDMQTTRISSNITKLGSAVEIKAFEKEEEVRQRPVGESFFNSMECTICLKSGTNQQKFEAIKN
jgi:hypothetical protein